MSKRSLLIAASAAIIALAPGTAARADDGSVAIAKDGRPTDMLALAKGRPTQVTATVDGRPAAHATWTAFPAGLLDVHDDGNGRATITSRKDLYDDPAGKEPRGRLAVCVENACYSVGVVGLIDASGRWHAHVVVGGVFGKDKDIDLTQDGRSVRYGGVVLKLEGSTLRLAEGGGLLLRLNGGFSSDASATGSWTSNRGFAGTWTVTR